MEKKLILAIGAAALVIVLGVIVFTMDSNRLAPKNNSSLSSVATSTDASNSVAPLVFNSESLAKNDGLNGNKCYVAVDGSVYDMTNFSLWANGTHSPTQGRARCGQELSKAMENSPHGKSKLSIMPKVGTFQ